MHTHTFTPDSHGVIVTVAEIRKPFKWRALLTQLIRGAPCIGKLADNAFDVCVCVMETRGSEEKQVKDAQDIKERERGRKLEKMERCCKAG